ncbi:hypothetical protein HW132_21000 [Brasilonema sp. CT11]|nr:hypothetical protein [Brasilonema sp. CT11]
MDKIVQYREIIRRLITDYVNEASTYEFLALLASALPHPGTVLSYVCFKNLWKIPV